MKPDKDELEKIVRFEEKILKTQQRVDRLAKKSFILSNQMQSEDPEDADLLQRVSRLREYQEENSIVTNMQMHNTKFWGILMKRNYDLVAWLLMDITANLGLYSLDTIKTRTQARNIFRDVSHFDKNNVKEQSLQRGLHYRLIYVVVSDVMRNLTNRLRISFFQDPSSIFYERSLLTKVVAHAFIQEGMIATLLLPLEIKKMQIQLGSFKMGFNPLAEAYVKCLFPAIARDSLFFLSHSLIYNYLLYGQFFTSALSRPTEFIAPNIGMRGDREKKFTCMLVSIAASILLTNPFDVIISKMATQREQVYFNPWQAAQQIYREEGFGKLMASSISARFGFYALKGFLFFTYQEHVLKLCQGAFEG